MSELEKSSSAKKYLVYIIFALVSVIFVSVMFSFTTELSPEASQEFGFSSWLVLAYLAGLSMIVLPCTLPFVFMIVPMTIDKGYQKGLLTAVLFGIGLTTTITLYGLGLAYLGQITGLANISTWLMLVAGLITYSYGLHRLGLVKIPTPSYSGTPGFMKNRGDYSKTYLMGLLVGNAGVGCTNPLFYLMLFYIMGTGEPVVGASLGFVHGIGRAIPLILVAILAIIGFNPTKGLLAKRSKVEKISAIILIIIGSFLIINTTTEGQAWYMNTVLHSVWNDFVDLTGMSDNMKILMMPGIDHSKMGHAALPADALIKITPKEDWKLYFWWEPGGVIGANQLYDYNIMFHEPITDIMQDNVSYDMETYINGKLVTTRNEQYAEDGWDVQKLSFPIRGSAQVVFSNINGEDTGTSFSFQVAPIAENVVRDTPQSQLRFPLELIPVFTAIMIGVPIIISQIKKRRQSVSD